MARGPYHWWLMRSVECLNASGVAGAALPGGFCALRSVGFCALRSVGFSRRKRWRCRESNPSPERFTSCQVRCLPPDREARCHPVFPGYVMAFCYSSSPSRTPVRKVPADLGLHPERFDHAFPGCPGLCMAPGSSLTQRDARLRRSWCCWHLGLSCFVRGHGLRRRLLLKHPVETGASPKIRKKLRKQGLNLRPPAPKAGALPD